MPPVAPLDVSLRDSGSQRHVEGRRDSSLFRHSERELLSEPQCVLANAPRLPVLVAWPCQASSLVFDVGCDGNHPLFLRTVGWGHGASNDGRGIKVPCDVLLVSVEALRFALSTMPHFGILHRDSPVWSHSLPNSRSARFCLLDVLVLYADQCLDIRLQGRARCFIERSLNPSVQ